MSVFGSLRPAFSRLNPTGGFAQFFKELVYLLRRKKAQFGIEKPFAEQRTPGVTDLPTDQLGVLRRMWIIQDEPFPFRQRDLRLDGNIIIRGGSTLAHPVGINDLAARVASPQVEMNSEELVLDLGHFQKTLDRFQIGMSGPNLPAVGVNEQNQHRKKRQEHHETTWIHV